MSKSFYFFIVLFILTFLLRISPAFAEDFQTDIGASRIVILAPKPGEMVPGGQEVKITYQLIHGLRDNGDHVHVYLDGENGGTAKHSPRSLGKLKPGKHVVLLKVSNHDHDLVHVEASVEFEVSAGQGHP